MFLNKKNPLFWLKKQPLTGDYLGWRIASILTVSIMILSAFASIWFIYYNIYTTITNTADIIILETTPHSDAIDVDAFEQAQKNLLLRSNDIVRLKDARNIFEYANTSSTLTSSL